MAPQIGRLRQVGIGKESVAGTAVAPTFWIPVESGSVVPDVEYQEDGGTVGRVEAPFQSEPIKENTITTFNAVARADWLGLLLLGTFGTCNSAAAAGEAAVYEHTLTVANTNAHPTLTAVLNDGIGDECSTYSMINSLTLSCDAMGLLTVECELIGKALVADSETPAYTTNYIWKGSNGSIKLASDVSGLAAASAIGFNKMSIKFEKNLVQHHAFGAISLSSNINTAFRVTGELELLYEATTYRDYVTDGTDMAMRVTFQNPTTIGNAEKPEITIDFAKVSFEEFGLTEGNDEVQIQTLGFVAQYDIDEGTPKMVSAVLTNTTASY
jgi:hypothetical protein